MVEEYLSLKSSNPKFSKSEKLDNMEIIDSSPINTSLVKEIKDESIPMSINKVRMKYNGAVIEFDESLLEKALNILKTW